MGLLNWLTCGCYGDNGSSDTNPNTPLISGERATNAGDSVERESQSPLPSSSTLLTPPPARRAPLSSSSRSASRAPDTGSSKASGYSLAGTPDRGTPGNNESIGSISSPGVASAHASNARRVLFSPLSSTTQIVSPTSTLGTQSLG